MVAAERKNAGGRIAGAGGVAQERSSTGRRILVCGVTKECPSANSRVQLARGRTPKR